MGRYIIANGENLRNIGINVLSIPAQVYPQRRLTTLEIKGRHGELTYWDGAYLGYDRTYRIHFKGAAEKAKQVAEYLMKTTTIITSDEPDKVYTVSFEGPTEIEKQLRDWKTFDITYRHQPIKHDVDPVSIIASTGPVRLLNESIVDAYPIIELTGTGTIVLTVGDRVITITGVAGKIIINSEIEECYLSNMTSKNNKMTGDFPILSAMTETAISWTGAVSEVIIHPNWGVC